MFEASAINLTAQENITLLSTHPEEINIVILKTDVNHI